MALYYFFYAVDHSQDTGLLNCIFKSGLVMNFSKLYSFFTISLSIAIDTSPFSDFRLHTVKMME